MHSFTRIATVFAFCLIGVGSIHAQVPAGYPADYAKVLEEAVGAKAVQSSITE